MKLHKEYPATHSMSTAWYVADEDGNVGIMDFNENGPVPWRMGDNSVDELVFGYENDYEKKEYLMVSLSNEQIDDLLTNPHSPEEEETWWDCVIQIDVTKENEFLELAVHPDIDLEFCVSKERGLYSIDAYRCTSETQKGEKYQILETSSLRKMLDKNIILQVFKKQSFWMDDDWDGEKVVHTQSFNSAPYYIFHQPYWSEFLPECMNVPEHPVKLEQLPESLQEKVLKLPIRFEETKQFQIAEWHPCNLTHCSDTPINVVDGCEYMLLPMTGGKKAYLNTEIILVSEFFKYCSEKEKYGCSECRNYCYTRYADNDTEHPTVLAILGPLSDWIPDMKEEIGDIAPRCVWLPFLPKIPYKIKKRLKPSELSSEKYEYDPSERDILKHVSGRRLLELFRKNKQWLEDQVARFNPRVILISGAAEAIMEAVYPIRDNRIEINGVSYPMYLLPEVETHREEIERLAAMPYQGKKIPHIISVEEMERIKQGK
ncbi:MAG: hypothetical protein IJ986_01750 [Bacteroidales bacterium]|nr:hypothetical protein [Bacteroidales bacterium]